MNNEIVKPQMPHLQVPIYWPMAFAFGIHFIFGSISDLFTYGFWHFLIGLTIGTFMLSFIFIIDKPRLIWRWVTIRSTPKGKEYTEIDCQHPSCLMCEPTPNEP